MAKVADILNLIKARAAVDAVILTTGDGLTLDFVAEPEIDVEAIAAYAASYATSSTRMGDETEFGAMDAVIVVYKGHAIVIAPVDKSVVLAAVGAGGAQLGKMHFQVQRCLADVAAALRDELQLSGASPSDANDHAHHDHPNGSNGDSGAPLKDIPLNVA